MISRDNIWAMFNRFSRSYDLVNRVMSGGMDWSWRRGFLPLLPNRRGLRVLDLATGTADVAIMLAKESSDVESVIGVDMAEDMLRVGREKVANEGLEEVISLQCDNAMALPFDDGSFDVVTISFGIRNMSDVSLALSEMRRVLCKEGRVLILETSLPKNIILQCGHLIYMRYVMPYIGGILSGDISAYRYLAKTAETFPYGEAFCQKMRFAGFKNVMMYPKCFGVVTIYCGDAS